MLWIIVILFFLGLTTLVLRERHRAQDLEATLVDEWKPPSLTFNKLDGLSHEERNERALKAFNMRYCQHVDHAALEHRQANGQRVKDRWLLDSDMAFRVLARPEMTMGALDAEIERLWQKGIPAMPIFDNGKPFTADDAIMRRLIDETRASHRKAGADALILPFDKKRTTR